MEPLENTSPIHYYWQYLQSTYPTVQFNLDPQLIADLEKTNWDAPQTVTDLNNFAVMVLIEAEQTDDLSLRTLYLETAIEALKQGVEESHPLCAAHLALVYLMLGEFYQARQLAFSFFLETIQPTYLKKKLPRGLIYLFFKPKSLAAIYTKQIENLLQAKDGYEQALGLLTEVIFQSLAVVYNLNRVRFLQLASQVIPDIPLIQFQLGIAHCLNQQQEGLFHLQKARKLDLDNPQIVQALFLAYRDLNQPDISQFWQQLADNYYQKIPQSHDWKWSQLPIDHAFTYISFDEEILLAVEPSLRSITTIVLLGQRDWFEAEMEFWRSQIQPEMTVIDVGANVGVYTFSAAKKVRQTGKVIAIEPFPGCVECLEETCRVNQFTQVKVYARAASDRNQTAFLALNSASELNEVVVGESVRSPSENLVEIQCCTLDSLIDLENLQRVDWLKLDAEGHEMQVLAGCQKLLAQFMPKILYENIAGNQSSNVEVAEYLLAREYQLFRYQPYLQQLIPIDSFEALEGNLNIIALPPDITRSPLS